MYFERKAYKKLTEWKAEYADKYAYDQVEEVRRLFTEYVKIF